MNMFLIFIDVGCKNRVYQRNLKDISIKSFNRAEAFHGEKL